MTVGLFCAAYLLIGCIAGVLHGRMGDTFESPGGALLFTIIAWPLGGALLILLGIGHVLDIVARRLGYKQSESGYYYW